MKKQESTRLSVNQEFHLQNLIDTIFARHAKSAVEEIAVSIKNMKKTGNKAMRETVAFVGIDTKGSLICGGWQQDHTNFKCRWKIGKRGGISKKVESW